MEAAKTKNEPERALKQRRIEMILSLTEINALRETRLAKDLLDMDSKELARETVDVVALKHTISSREEAALREELAGWAHDELMALWDGCQVEFVTLCPSVSDRWMERCTVKLDTIIDAVPDELANLLRKGESIRFAQKWLKKHPHSVQEELEALEQRLTEFRAEKPRLQKEDRHIVYQLQAKLDDLRGIEASRKRYMEIINDGLD